jgi:acyl carrier protein
VESRTHTSAATHFDGRPLRRARRIGMTHDLTTAEIYRKLVGIFRDVFDDETLVIAPELTAADVDEWDSLSHIRLVLTVEKNFRINFTASEVANLKNVAEFVELIKLKFRVSYISETTQS